MNHKIFRISALALFLTLGSGSALASASGGPIKCSDVLTSTVYTQRLFSQMVPHFVGIVLGSANGVVMTASSGQYELMPADAAKWLPFFNEIANASSTTTGKQWIYSGTQKQVIDGIALGALGGQALRVTAEKGPLAGALTLGVSVGLSYWFPNKYFHPIMTGIPKTLPEKLKIIARSKPGMGVIGISLIYILEHVLEHAQQIAQAIPQYFSMTQGSTAKITRSPSQEAAVSLEHAVALWILDAALPETLSHDNRMHELLYLSGANLWGNFFTTTGVFERPQFPISEETKETIKEKFNSKVMSQLLTATERESVLSKL
jgi:hypothetical protein